MAKEKEKVLFKFGNLFFSPNKKNWAKVELVATDKQIWIKSGQGWQKFAHDAVSVVEMKPMADNKSSSLELDHKGNDLFVGGSKATIYTVYNQLLSILPSGSKVAKGMKFTNEKRLVLKSLAQGVRVIGDISHLTNIEYEIVQEIFDEFKNSGLITPSGVLTDKGKVVMLEEGYR